MSEALLYMAAGPGVLVTLDETLDLIGSAPFFLDPKGD